MIDYYEYLHLLLVEKSKWQFACLANEGFDFTKMREYATALHGIAPKTYPFIVDGSDLDLIKSIVEAEKKYRP